MGTGAIPSIVSTLERRYGFSSTLLGTLIGFGDAVSVVIAIPMSHYGARVNKARVLAIGFICHNVGIALFALPHFVTGRYQPEGSTQNTESICAATGDDT